MVFLLGVLEGEFCRRGGGGGGGVDRYLSEMR